MDPALLIDAIVRQTTVLIATLATTSGQRAQLAHVANSVFADLVFELRAQGVGNKVIADMFGMALRTYHRRVARMSASRTEQGRSLWEAVLRHIQERRSLPKSALFEHFYLDDEAVLRSVVNDLVDAGLVQRTGRDGATTFEAAEVTREAEDGIAPRRRLAAMALVALHRGGPLDLGGLAEVVPADASELRAAVEQLAQDGSITVRKRGGRTLYGCDRCVIPFGDGAGWEAAVLDHYRAMVSALVAKLRDGRHQAALADQTGGSTFVFDLHRGHPLEQEVLGYLQRMREEGLRLRSALDRHAAENAAPAGVSPLRVIAYVGQGVVETELGEEGGADE